MSVARVKSRPTLTDSGRGPSRQVALGWAGERFVAPAGGCDGTKWLA
jgi:hypothetical protein